jgi:hypothetical protein
MAARRGPAMGPRRRPERGAGTTPTGDATSAAAADGPRGRVTAPGGRGGPPLLFRLIIRPRNPSMTFSVYAN